MSYEIVNGDLSPGMSITITRDGTAVDASSADSVQLQWVEPDGTLRTADLVAVDAAAGQYIMNWSAGDTDQTGTYFGQVVVTEGGVETSYPNDGSRIIWWVNPNIDGYDVPGGSGGASYSGVAEDRLINTTGGLQGGGDLGANLTLSIQDNGVTLAKLADMDTGSILGRASTGTGDPEVLTGTQATGLLDVATVFNVKRAPYNATGDGVTDDRVAIQSAIDAANAAGGGTVWLPNGTYRVSRTSSPSEGCLYLYTNVSLVGQSRQGSIIKMADNQNSFTRVIRVQGQDDVQIRNLTIDGNKSGQSVPEEHMAGIFHGSCKRFVVENCELRNCCGDGAQVYSSCEDVLYQNCYVHDNDRGGLTVTGTGSARLSFINCQCVDNADQQIDTELAGAGTLSDVHVRGCHLRPRASTNGPALTCSGFSSTNQATGFVVSECFIEAGTYIIWAKNVRFVNNKVVIPSGLNGSPLQVDRKCENVVIAHNQIHSQSVESSINAAVYIQGTTTDNKPVGVIIDGNYIETANNASGVRISNAHSASVINNRIVGNSTVASTRAGVSITAGEGDPLYQMHTAMVSGNWITDFGRGLLVAGSAGDPDNAIYELQVVNNVFQRVNHASMQALELNFGSGNIADRATVFGNVPINITTMFTATTGWPSVPTLIGGNRGAGGIYSGSGSPDGVLTETVGAMYFDRSGSTGSTMWVKEAGTGNTGWVAK